MVIGSSQEVCCKKYTVSDMTLSNSRIRELIFFDRIGEDNWRVMTSPGSCLLNTRQFVTIVLIMELCKDYPSIIELALWVLEKSNDVSMYAHVLDCLRKYSIYWKLTNNGRRIAEAVWAKVSTLCTR